MNTVVTMVYPRAAFAAGAVDKIKQEFEAAGITLIPIECGDNAPWRPEFRTLVDPPWRFAKATANQQTPAKPPQRRTRKTR